MLSYKINYSEKPGKQGKVQHGIWMVQEFSCIYIYWYYVVAWPTAES